MTRRVKDQIEQVARGMRPADVLAENDPNDDFVADTDGSPLRIPPKGHPDRCPDCGGSRALRVGYTWCGAIPNTPCNIPGGGEPHQDDLINAKIKAHPYRYRRR